MKNFLGVIRTHHCFHWGIPFIGIQLVEPIDHTELINLQLYADLKLLKICIVISFCNFIQLRVNDLSFMMMSHTWESLPKMSFIIIFGIDILQLSMSYQILHGP